MTTDFARLRPPPWLWCSELSLAAAGCGKYSFSALKAQKAFKDGNDRYRAQDWKGAAAKYEDAQPGRPQQV